MTRPILDPMTNKMHDLAFNSQEDFLWKVLEAACKNECPPDSADYLCDGVGFTDEDESKLCAQCYTNWAAKAGEPRTPLAKRILEAIGMAISAACPPDVKDYVCKAGEDDDTSEETCTDCLKRWAALPFWKERNK